MDKPQAPRRASRNGRVSDLPETTNVTIRNFFLRCLAFRLVRTASWLPCDAPPRSFRGGPSPCTKKPSAILSPGFKRVVYDA
jgi:hypothetical protein